MTDNQRTKWLSRAMLVGAMLAALTADRAWAADKTCLTGNDPAVAADSAQIAALEANIAAACPCATFDGSDGKERRDYLRCVVPLIKTAVENGELRAKCKSRVKQAHTLSSCGRIGVLPCIESKANGKFGCRITTAEKCQSDSRSTRTACSSYARCVDAGDTNGDLVVAAGDSGACIVPPTATFTAAATPSDTATRTGSATATPTATATSTDTPTPTPTSTDTAAPTDTATSTDTPTPAPTSTETATPTDTATFTATVPPTATPSALPTEPPDFGWTYCAAYGETCELPGNREVRYGFDSTYKSQFVSAPSVVCSGAVFDPEGEFDPIDEPHCDYFIDGPTRTPTGTPSPTAVPPTHTPEAGWVFCSNEGDTCIIPSPYRLVRYGVPGAFIEDVADTTSFPCTNARFGSDPAYQQAKHCEYAASDEVLPTYTATPTTTPTATHTSLPPTATPTRAPEWIRCAGPGEFCDLPARDQLVSFGGFPPSSAYITTVSGTSVECSPEALFPDRPEIHAMTGDCYYMSWTCDYDTQPVGYLAVNRFGDFPETYELLRPALDENGCFYHEFIYGSVECRVRAAFSADLDNELAAFVVDTRICSADDEAHIAYHWTIRYPTGASNNSAIYAPQGITGYREPVLRIAPQSMPTLDGIGGDRSWKLNLEITRQPHTDFPMTPAPIITNQHWYFRYSDAAASIAMATACQAHYAPHPSCQIDELLRAPEGTY